MKELHNMLSNCWFLQFNSITFLRINVVFLVSLMLCQFSKESQDSTNSSVWSSCEDQTERMNGKQQHTKK